VVADLTYNPKIGGSNPEIGIEREIVAKNI